MPTSSPGLNFTSNSFHQVNAAIPGLASSIAQDPAGADAALAKYAAQVPYGQTSLLPVLEADVAIFEHGGSTIGPGLAGVEINRLFSNLLGRSPNAAELSAGTQALQVGVTSTQVADSLVQSNEFVQDNITPGATPNADQIQFVTALYEDVLNREPDAAGLGFWVNTLASGSMSVQQVAHAFVYSPEAAASRTPQAQASQSITNLFEDFLGRAPVAVELSAGIQALQGGVTIPMVADTIVGSEEYVQDNITPGASANADQIQFVTALYNDVFDRDPDTAGLAGWVNELATGALTPQQVAYAFVGSPEASTSPSSTILADSPVPDGTDYYFGTVVPNGPITGNFTGSGATVQLENLIQQDTLTYLSKGIGKGFNILKSGVNYSSDSLLTYNGHV